MHLNICIKISSLLPVNIGCLLSLIFHSMETHFKIDIFLQRNKLHEIYFVFFLFTKTEILKGGGVMWDYWSVEVYVTGNMYSTGTQSQR